MSEDIVLIKVDKATILLRDAENLSTPKDLRALAKGAISILKARRDSTLESMNHAVEIKIRCERRIGQLLKEQPKARGRAEPGPRGSEPRPRKTLKEKGLTKDESSRFQKMAAVEEAEFEAIIAETKEKKGELTTEGVLAHTKKKKQKDYYWAKCPTCNGKGKIKMGGNRDEEEDR